MLKYGLSKHSVGNITIFNADGTVIFEGHVRQCVHCQHTWTYAPGSGILRGICGNCNGHTCGQPQCDTCYHKEKRIEDIEAIAMRNKKAIEAAVRQRTLREAVCNYLGSRHARNRYQAMREGRMGPQPRIGR